MGLPVASDFCARASIDEQEPMLGTAAASTSIWLGIEVQGPWPRNAFDCASVPDALRHALDGWAADLPNLRPQALRRPGRDQGSTPEVVLALTGPDCETVVRVDVASLDELAGLDLVSVVGTLRAGGVPSGVRPVEEPMVWVCVHGKRDRCCAKFGAPVYDAAIAAEGVVAWQTSHLGGHRFAATLLCLPKGLCYGRVRPADVEPLLRSHASGRVFDLTRLRGRSCWSAPSQAAVHFVRAHLAEMALDGVVPTSEVVADDGVRVRVESPKGAFDVRVQRRPIGGEAPPSCEKPPAPVQGWFQLELASA